MTEHPRIPVVEDPASDGARLTGSPPLQGERVSFTGTLASMTHRQAHEVVEEQGGVPTHHVSRQTTMLVVGEEGWPLEPDGQPSQKLQQVTAWRQGGLDVRILRESDWLHLLGLEERRRDVHRLYTPAMLSQMLSVSVGTIRRWERLGLIKPARKVYRLPYFDFQEVAGVRRLTELLAAGVSRNELEAGLKKLKTLLPNVDRPLAQLDVLAGGSRLVYRDAHSLVEPKTGQRRFDFEDEQDEFSVQRPASRDRIAVPSGSGRSTLDSRLNWTAEDWAREGCRLLDENEPASAVEAFRLSLTERPGDAELHFHLAEALYRLGNRAGALERYYAAAEIDHEYLEAWTHIGCLHAELGELESAVQAFRIALDVHADYPDAHWHMADVLEQLDRRDEAVPHWRTYLQFDSRGPWAEQARQRLEEGLPMRDER